MTKLLSIVIPTRDEEASIGLLLRDINVVKKKLAKKWRMEVIVVDNSKDKTPKIAKKLGARVIFDKTPGKGSAMRVGFKAAKGDYIAMMDGDYSHRAEDLPPMLKEIEKGAHFVMGSRKTGGSDEYNLVRGFGNHFLTFAYNVCFLQWRSDALNGYKVFSRDVFTAFPYHSKYFSIELELIANAQKLGYPTVEVPAHERERVGGKMKSSALIHGPELLWGIISNAASLWWYRIRHIGR